MSIFLGIGGLQWKHHLGNKVDVTINELNSATCQQIKKHCVSNNFTTSDYKPIRSEGPNLNPNSFSDTPRVIEMANYDANVILHQTQYHFV